MNRVSIIRTITPLHVGTGQAAGPVDLPIARERATGWPVIPGSSVKGVLRDAATTDLIVKGEAKDDKEAEKLLKDIFGTTPKNAEDQGKAGALCTTDMRIVFFPVRSYAGTFAYVTSPLAIARLLELLEIAGQPIQGIDPKNLVVTEGCLVTADSVLKATNTKVLFEDFDLDAKEDASGTLAKLGEFLAEKFGTVRDNVAKRLAVVSDTVFSFLVESATEIVTHVTLEFETKTAKQGGLRSEESVPAEAIFAGLVTVPDDEQEAQKHADSLKGVTIQFGGKASTGMGLCRFEVV